MYAKAIATVSCTDKALRYQNQHGCGSLVTDEEHRSRFALMLVNCHLASTGLATYPCADKTPIARCLKAMSKDDKAFNAYTAFMLQVHGLCLAAQSDDAAAYAEYLVGVLLDAASQTRSELVAYHNSLRAAIGEQAESLHAITAGVGRLGEAYATLESASARAGQSLAVLTSGQEQLIGAVDTLDGKHTQLLVRADESRAALDGLSNTLDSHAEATHQLFSKNIEALEGLGASAARLEESHVRLIAKSGDMLNLFGEVADRLGVYGKVVRSVLGVLHTFQDIAWTIGALVGSLVVCAFLDNERGALKVRLLTCLAVTVLVQRFATHVWDAIPREDGEVVLGPFTWQPLSGRDEGGVVQVRWEHLNPAQRQPPDASQPDANRTPNTQHSRCSHRIGQTKRRGTPMPCSVAAAGILWRRW